MAVVTPDPLGEGAYLVGLEMVDSGRDPGATEVRDQLGGLLDRFRTVVVGPRRRP